MQVSADIDERDALDDDASYANDYQEQDLDEEEQDNQEICAMHMNDRALFNYAVAGFSDWKIKEQYNRLRDPFDEEIAESDIARFKRIYASLHQT